MKTIFDAIACRGLPSRDLKNANIVNLWTISWVVSLGLISFISKSQWYSSGFPTILAFTVQTVIGIGMLLAYVRFVKNLDEMERKIQLDALAVSVGVTVVGFASYSVLDMSGVVPDLKSSYLIALIALTYMAGILFGRIRYR